MTSSPVFRSALPYDDARVRAAAIYCSDGRYNEQFDDFLHNKLSLPRYDRVVLPGGPACLAGHLVAHRDEAALSEQLQFLIRSHLLERIVLIAHEACGYYHKRMGVALADISTRQRQDLARAAARVHGIAAAAGARPFAVDAYIAWREQVSEPGEPPGVAFERVST